MIAALTTYVLVLYGLAAEHAGLTRQYQSNTQTRRKVISLMFLGHEAWRRQEIFQCREILSRQALQWALTGLAARIEAEAESHAQ